MYQYTKNQTGFSLIELMIGMVIGLIATLVIANVFSQFEQQKSTTVGNADAQTNGAIAIYQIRRELQTAGFGLPLFQNSFTPLKCYENDAKVSVPLGSAESVTVDHDGDATTPEIGLSPVIITDSADGTSDAIAIRYGNTQMAGVASKVANANSQTAPILTAGLGCKTKTNLNQGNFALIMSETSVNTTAKVCEMVDVRRKIDRTLRLLSTPDLTVKTSSYISCVGEWNEKRFAIDNNTLTVTGARRTGSGSIDATPVDVVPEIVNIQAQYGISSSDIDNNVANWVDATGATWSAATMTVDNRNRIKAVRIAIVARSNKRENTAISQQCSDSTSGLANVCIWQQDANPANVDLTDIADWQNYRYKVYETTVPLQNVLMNKPALCAELVDSEPKCSLYQ